jgi:GT2 family glycosyltransferase
MRLWRVVRKNLRWPSFRTFNRNTKLFLIQLGLLKDRETVAQTELIRTIEDDRRESSILFRQRLAGLLTSDGRLVFPHHDAPEISIVIPLLDNAHLTLTCLQALDREARSGTAPKFEIVLIDNGSRDETTELLPRLDGVHVIRNGYNAGYPRACNQGAAAARGRVVLLLNSDAAVRQGALAAALATLDDDATIGAVGGRLILPGNVLQEAGSIVWSDGSTVGYGRGWSPERGEAMFRRDTDFCSGAFLMTPMAIWQHLGGLDEGYSPAYYEDTDYCLRLWERGLRVVYEPDAAVDHFERGSEVAQGHAISFSMRNRKWFRSRHAQELRRWHYPSQPPAVTAARVHRRSAKRSLLVIDNEVPIPAFGQGLPRAHQLLIAANDLGWSVCLFAMHQPNVDWKRARVELPKDIELITERTHTGLADFLADRSNSFDVILVSRPDNYRSFRQAVRSFGHLLHGVRIVYDAEALFAKRDITRAAVNGAPMPAREAAAKIDSEIALTEGADAIVCVSDDEAAEFRSRVSVPVHRLSHAISVRRGPPGFAQRRGFLFVGSLHERDAPNFQGLSWFVREIWPLVRRQLPSATLTVAGTLSDQHDDLAGPGVHLAGLVDVLTPLYDAARVFIAPVRFAAGVPLKILEATAAGLPTVSTCLMAEQLGWLHGHQILAHDQPEDVARSCIELHENNAKWSAIRDDAQRIAENEHGVADFRLRVAELLQQPRPSSI